MMRIEAVRLLPVTPAALFDLMSDLSRWPLFYPDFVRFAGRPPVTWEEPGASLTVVTRLLGREVSVEMTLEELRPGRLVRYRSRQRGMPDAVHERGFIGHPAGCVFLAAISYAPRRGLPGLVDDVLLRRAVARKLRLAGANLARLVEATAGTPAEGRPRERAVGV